MKAEEARRYSNPIPFFQEAIDALRRDIEALHTNIADLQQQVDTLKATKADKRGRKPSKAA